MALAHTYYLAWNDHIAGERASDEALAAMLRELWNSRGAAPEQLSIVDGVSAWIDDAGVPQVRVIRAAQLEMVADDAVVAPIAARLTA
jgi:hypothetical protein